MWMSSVTAPTCLVAHAAKAITLISSARQSSPGGSWITLRGVITAFSGWRNSYFLQDGTGAISVDRQEDAKAESGDEVEVSGQIQRGRFAPIFLSSRTRVITRRPLPKARAAAFDALVRGDLDSQRVEVTGVVHAVRVTEIWGKQVLLLDLQTPAGIIRVHVLSYPSGNLEYLVDSTIRVRGVCGTIFNDRPQLTGLRLFVPTLTDVFTVKPAVGLDLLPISPLSELRSFKNRPQEHRLKVTGTVTYCVSKHEFYLQQNGTAIRVQTTEPGDCEPGARLNVAGFVANEGYLPSLEHAFAERLNRHLLPQPIHMKAMDAIKTKDGFFQTPYNGMLVQLEGDILELLPNTETQLWAVYSSGIRFQVQLARNGHTDLLLEPGTRVSVTGICLAEPGSGEEPKSFRILLRTPWDVRIIKEPYSSRSVLFLLVLLLPVFLASLLIWLLKGNQIEALWQREHEVTSLPMQRRFRRASVVIALLVTAIGALIVVGWALDIPFLQGRFLHTTPVPNTALAIVAVGLTIVIANRRGTRSTAIAYSACAWTAITTGALTLIEHVTSWDIHFDQLLVRNLGSIANTMGKGRMPVAASLAILLVGCATLLLCRKRLAGLGQVLVLGAGVISLFNMVDRVYGDGSHYGLGAHVSMALASAAPLALLSVALLFSRPDCGLMKTVTTSGTGGLMLRRVLPAVVVAPILLGWVRLYGQYAGLYDTRFGGALFAMSNILCFGFVVWISASMLNRLDGSRSLAERALRERDQRLEMIFEHASIGDYTWDVQKDEITAHHVIWGLYSAPERCGSAPADWFRNRQHPEDLAEIDSKLKSAISQRLPLDIQFRVVQSDLSVRWIACRASGVYNDSGKLIQMNGISFDVTNSKLAEQRIIESETQFRQLADAMPQIVWTAGRDGRLDYCNQRWYEFTGAPFDSSWEQNVHPEDSDLCRAEWVESVAHGFPYQMELRLRRKSDGSHRWHLARAVPYRDARGEIERWFGTFTDIDDAKQARANLQTLNDELESRVIQRSSQLAASERRHRLLVASVKDYAIFMLDSAGMVTTWNAGAERIKQYCTSEIVGRHFSVFYTPEDRASGHPQRVLAKALVNGHYTEEGWRLRKDGSRFWASVLITPMRDDEGTLSGFSKITRDLTEQKRAERLLFEREQAEAANRAKSAFLASMSHEIRTPMNAILGMADLLWETELNKVQREYVGRFRRAGTNLLSLINDILDLSKIESGRFDLESVDFSPRDLVARTMELMLPRAGVKNIELTTSIDPATPTAVIGDSRRLQQILNNLVSNAIKFTEKGSIVVTVSNHPDNQPCHLQFAVRDTGIGIPSDKLEDIFDEFTQAESSTTRRFGGTGLGLAICRRLVAYMGGTLTVESVFGEGSTFSFDVILSFCEEMKTRPETKELTDFADCRVLVVDDDSTNRLILSDTCNGWGMTVTQVTTAAEALKLVEASIGTQDAFSLVLLDSVLPDLNGMAVLRRLRELDPDLPIILNSSDHQPGDMTKAKALGAVAYLTRPVRRADLLTSISAALRSSSGRSSQDLASAAPDSIESPKSILTILIADDSEDNRFLLSAYLENRSYELTFAENGQLALEAFQSGYFDLVLMDIQMPVMDGLAATAAIRAWERQQHARPTPIVALTANALLEDVERSTAAGCDAHLAKPISKERLIASIESFLGALVPGVDPEIAREKRKYLVEVPEGLERHSREYVSARRSEVSRMMNFLPGQGIDELRVFGHNLKGTGLSFGFPELTRLGAAIEEAARSSNTSQIAEHLAEVRDYVEYASEALA